MKRTAVVVAPGRGTYNKAELGYLARHHARHRDLIAEFDAYRLSQNQPAISALDGAERFSALTHTRGDHASPLIYSCAYADFLAIDREQFDVVAVTGNSMGWYIALACAGALDAFGGLQVVNTMGTLMQEKLIGGQLIYSFVDDEWREIPGLRESILTKMADIDARKDHDLRLSIDLGGMIVLGGNDTGLKAFETEMPKQERFPLRLQNHAAFHTALQEPVAAIGRERLAQSLFKQPRYPLIDGRGGVWLPKASDLPALWSYTLDHQVVRPYDFTAAIRTAANEFMPDVFIVLGPGTTLGGAIAQSLVRAGWRGMRSKEEFQREQSQTHRMLALGMDQQRHLVQAADT